MKYTLEALTGLNSEIWTLKAESGKFDFINPNFFCTSDKRDVKTSSL